MVSEPLTVQNNPAASTREEKRERTLLFHSFDTIEGVILLGAIFSGFRVKAETLAPINVKVGSTTALTIPKRHSEASSIKQKEVFDSLHPAAQIYIRHLEETIRAQQETIRKQEIRIHQT